MYYNAVCISVSICNSGAVIVYHDHSPRSQLAEIVSISPVAVETSFYLNNVVRRLLFVIPSWVARRHMAKLAQWSNPTPMGLTDTDLVTRWSDDRDDA